MSGTADAAGWRFVLQRRYLGYLAVAVLFAIGCGFLSHWQFSRNAEAVAEVERIQANYDRDPQPISAVLPALDSYSDDVKWTPVEVTGSYLVEDQLLVRNRPYNGNPGFEVLVPLLTDDGSVFIVDRGWVPSGDTQDAPDAVPAAPSGRVTVVARVKAGEPEIAGRSAPAGEIPTIELDDIAAMIDLPTYTGAYGLLASEDPAPATRPLAAEEPTLDTGPYLSYAIQWIAFAAFGFFFLGYVVWNERRLRREAAEEAGEIEPRPPRRPRRPRRRTDAEIEDELLDAGGVLRR
ncbi:MAG: SURF1 family protein [Microbacteriaceae bacterium]